MGLEVLPAMKFIADKKKIAYTKAGAVASIISTDELHLFTEPAPAGAFSMLRSSIK